MTSEGLFRPTNRMDFTLWHRAVPQDMQIQNRAETIAFFCISNGALLAEPGFGKCAQNYLMRKLLRRAVNAFGRLELTASPSPFAHRGKTWSCNHVRVKSVDC